MKLSERVTELAQTIATLFTTSFYVNFIAFKFGTAFKIYLDGNPTQDRILQLPNKDGDIALLSDIKKPKSFQVVVPNGKARRFYSVQVMDGDIVDENTSVMIQNGNYIDSDQNEGEHEVIQSVVAKNVEQGAFTVEIFAPKGYLVGPYKFNYVTS